MGYEALVTEAVRTHVTAETERWLRAGLSTERCDRPAAEAAVAAVYRAHDMPAPRTIVWMDSPLGGALASWTLRHGWEDRLDGTLFGDVGAGPPLRVSPEFAQRSEERIGEQLPAGGNSRPGAGRARRMLGGTFCDTTRAENQLTHALGHPLHDQLDMYWLSGEPGAYELEQEMSRIFSWPDGHPLDHFGALVHRHLVEKLRGPVPERIVQPVADGDVITPPPPPSREWIYFHEEFGGHLDTWFDARRLIHRRCMLAAAGLPASPALEAVQEALYRVGGWWPLEDAVVLTERPVVLRYEEAAPDGPKPTNVLFRPKPTNTVISYADGYQVEERQAGHSDPRQARPTES
ncbi:hypothetical protein [Streptomyces sp. DSM 40750]|uniref:hypothetical protein n=1 Tax=Streptomyces sp. DSM 40750 TaxID=2801030 RepID=UPI00214BFCE5|nr:hypothetical protein [Streptomyces sp. DSM 40750]UUU22920.1 hypothetical protein JIX55_22960 [Streptomyces sp. DSM 40750]